MLTDLRHALAHAGDPKKAAQMQRYMKSAMPYHGVPAPEFRQIVRPVFSPYEFDSAARWKKDVLALWSGAKFREERYAAVELALHRKAGELRDFASLSLFERLIIEGAWWDFVDPLASHGLGEILEKEPAAMKRAMRQWSADDDLWKRRSSIICQLHLKGPTDLKLLYDCIGPSIGSKEFFLRKAIGWALRQHAWVDPKEIQRYVAAHPELSGLSRREALKNIQ